MDGNMNHINNRLGEKLPSHSPDQGAWQRLSDKLDVLNAESVYQEKLQELPIHSPDQGTWNVILSQINRIAFYKTGIRIAILAAAGLLLLFTVSRIPDQYLKLPNSIPQVARQEKLTKPHASSSTRTKTLIPKETEISKSDRRNVSSAYNMVAKTAGIQGTKTVMNESETVAESNGVKANFAKIPESITIESGSEYLLQENENVLITKVVGNKTTGTTENSTGIVTQSIQIQDSTSPAKEIVLTEDESKSILFQKDKNGILSPLLNNSVPIDPKPVNNKNHFALAMNYLPENIKNGTNTSLFHNVDLTASYNKEKVRFNTSLGMAYNEEQLQFDMSYDINSLVPGITTGGKIDTVSVNVAKVDSKYTGNEKHQYFTYNLGLGRRLLSSGKFSTWLNLGAGFGLLLNNPDLITATENSVKSMYNAQLVNVSSSTPVYNEVNVNVVTAIDFNYKIFNRLSITFTPTSRWYLKPVLSLDKQATDKLTFGFKTGMKIDF